jgi:endonuclease YncB( thermonuclease family)
MRALSRHVDSRRTPPNKHIRNTTRGGSTRALNHGASAKSMRLASALICYCLLAAHPLAAQEVRAVAQIVDADTIYAGSVKIRLSGIDAPEMDQLCLDGRGQSWSCGIEAKNQLSTFSRNRLWVCELTDVDRYGRSLGSCAIEGEDVSRWLVRNGWALAFRRYSSAYVRDEDYAREQRHGLWNGAFIAPWDWRHRGSHTAILGAVAVPTDAQRQLISPAFAAAPPASNCVIKGNLSRRDQCIYHVPGGQFYDRLNMESHTSRRWFCSEAEAQAAGCRKSRL